MTTITVPAIYQGGVLKPQVKLDLPEGTAVEVQITSEAAVAPTAPSLFGSLAGIWGHLSPHDLDQMEADLAEIRRQSSERIERLARELDEDLNRRDA